MSTVLGDVLVRYKGDISDLSSKVKQATSEIASTSEAAQKASGSLNEMGKSAEKTSSGFGGMIKNALSFAAGQAMYTGVADAVGFLKDQTIDAFKAAMDHQQIMVQTAQALKSTKDASGETAQGLQDLAESFSKVTPFSEDSIQSAENLELTFTNIGKSVMPQATQSILDVSQAMGQDLKSSTIQIGKALGDPITGMSALQRIGVTFSATEKEQIKTMMAHNDVIGAQKVILKELSTEFGGSATAAGKTFAGQMDILKNKFTDFKIKVATDALPVLQNFLGFVTGSVLPGLGRFANSVTGFLQPFGYLFQFVASKAKGAFGDIRDTLDQVQGLFSTIFSLVGGGGGDNPLAQFFDDGISKAYAVIQNFSTGFHSFMADVTKAIDALNPQDIVSFFSQIKSGFTSFLGAIGPGIQQAASILGGQFKTDLAWLGSTIKQIAGWAQSQLLPAIAQLGPPIETVAGAVASNILPALAHLYAIGHQVAEAVLTPLIGLFEHILPPVISFAALLAGGIAAGFQLVAPLAAGLVNILGGLVDFFTTTELGGDLVKATLIALAIPVGALVIGFGVLAVQAIAGFIAAIPGMVEGFIASATGAWSLAAGVIAATWPILAIIAVITGIILLITHWGQVMSWLGNLFGTIGNWIHGVISNIISWFQNLAGVWKVVGALLLLPFAPFIAAIVGIVLLITHWGQVMSWLGGVAGAIGSFVGGVFSGLGSFLHGVIGGIGGAFSGLGTLIHTIWDGIVSHVKEAINIIILGINWFIGFIDAIQIHIPSVGVGPFHSPSFDWGGLGIPKIPLLASGGDASGWFIAGEQGPELIHATGAHVYSNAQTKAMLGGQQAAYPIRPNVASVAMAASAGSSASSASAGHTTIIELDSVELARHIQPATDRLARLKLGPRGRAA